MDLPTLLKILCIVGALFCGGAYVWGYVLKPKGTRRLHTASLLFSALALGNAAVLIPTTVTPASTVASVNIVVFLFAAAVLQALTAFRGRKEDRRAGDVWTEAERQARLAANAPKVTPIRPAA